MQIQVNTDRNIDGRDQLSVQVRAAVDTALGRFRDRITRVEVHLSDENSTTKGGGADIRCMMEARLNGRPPTAVTEKAATMAEAMAGAAEKLKRVLESTIERLQDR